MNRLQTVTEPSKTTAYTYDLKGNRQSVTVTEGSTITYILYEYTNNNRLKYETKRNGVSSGTIIQKKEYTYDNNGNLTTVKDITSTPSVITTNTYTLLNQLENSTTAGKTMKNTYNAEGKRVSKILNTGAPTRYFYEGNKAVFEYANGGTVTAFNVIGTNLISRKIGTSKVYYFYNGHGDVTVLLDASTKKVRSQYAYDAFGNVTNEKYYDSNGVLTTNPAQMIKSPIRYGEYQYDSETEYTDADGKLVTGLYYLNERHYDPGTARLLEMDTYTGDISDPLSLNLYSYCRNEPIMYTDPTGHYTEGRILGYNSTQVIKDKDVEELQRDLKTLGYLNGTDYSSGIFDTNTLLAVNKFKDLYVKGGNKDLNRGKVGDTTWIYLKREVALKNAQSGNSVQRSLNEAKALKEFKEKYDKLFSSKSKGNSSSGNVYDNGKSKKLGDISYILYDATDKETFTDSELEYTKKIIYSRVGEGTNIKVFPINSKQEFVDIWNAIDDKNYNVKMVISSFHGTKISIDTPESSLVEKDVKDLNNKKIDTLILASCLSGDINSIYNIKDGVRIVNKYNMAANFAINFRDIDKVEGFDGKVQLFVPNASRLPVLRSFVDPYFKSPDEDKQTRYQVPETKEFIDRNYKGKLIYQMQNNKLIVKERKGNTVMIIDTNTSEVEQFNIED